MSRTFVYSALVLRNRPSGESNSEITLLTAEEGIIKATVYGGPKSKLRSHSAPYNSGQVWIYRDPAKDYSKLNDFDVHSWRPGLRELYERTMAASAVAETILSTHGGGGDWGSALKMAAATLDALETRVRSYATVCWFTSCGNGLLFWAYVRIWKTALPAPPPMCRSGFPPVSILFCAETVSTVEQAPTKRTPILYI